MGGESTWPTLVKELTGCQNAQFELWTNSYSVFLMLPISLFFPKVE